MRINHAIKWPFGSLRKMRSIMWLGTFFQNMLNWYIFFRKCSDNYCKCILYFKCGVCKLVNFVSCKRKEPWLRYILRNPKKWFLCIFDMTYIGPLLVPKTEKSRSLNFWYIFKLMMLKWYWTSLLSIIRCILLGIASSPLFGSSINTR